MVWNDADRKATCHIDTRQLTWCEMMWNDIYIHMVWNDARTWTYILKFTTKMQWNYILTITKKYAVDLYFHNHKKICGGFTFSRSHSRSSVISHYKATFHIATCMFEQRADFQEWYSIHFTSQSDRCHHVPSCSSVIAHHKATSEHACSSSELTFKNVNFVHFTSQSDFWHRKIHMRASLHIIKQHRNMHFRAKSWLLRTPTLYICMRILVISMGVVMTIWHAPARPPESPSSPMLPTGYTCVRHTPRVASERGGERDWLGRVRGRGRGREWGWGRGWKRGWGRGRSRGRGNGRGRGRGRGRGWGRGRWGSGGGRWIIKGEGPGEEEGEGAWGSVRCCSVLQCVAVCCSVLQCAWKTFTVELMCRLLAPSKCVAVCCSVLQCGAVWCSVLQCGAMCYSVCERLVL